MSEILESLQIKPKEQKARKVVTERVDLKYDIEPEELAETLESLASGCDACGGSSGLERLAEAIRGQSGSLKELRIRYDDLALFPAVVSHLGNAFALSEAVTAALESFESEEDDDGDDGSDENDFIESKTQSEAAPERRSDKPLAAHAAAASKYAELRRAQQEIEQQAAALNAMAIEKSRLAGAMEPELIRYAREYKDRTIRLNDILIQLIDIPAHKSQTPQYKKFIDWAFVKFESISSKMRKEAEKFLEACHREIGGEKDVFTYKLIPGKKKGESTMAEAWSFFSKLMDQFKKVAASIRGEILDLEQRIDAFKQNA